MFQISKCIFVLRNQEKLFIKKKFSTIFENNYQIEELVVKLNVLKIRLMIELKKVTGSLVEPTVKPWLNR